MLESIENICDVESLHPDSPWTCPKYRVTFDASVIWGLIGPGRLFGHGGLYRNLVWLFLVGAVLPVPVWVLSKIFPEKKWIPLINIPVISYGFAGMPPATPTNIASWLITGTIFNYFVFRYRKGWWQKYNYLSTEEVGLLLEAWEDLSCRTFASRLFSSISNLQLRYPRLVLLVSSEKLPLAAKHYRQRPMFVSTSFSVCPVIRRPFYHAGSKGESESADAKPREDALPWSTPHPAKNRED
ncbi:hypothetical protein BHM03_00026538 [Ensete ventricosum]|nr:hypothetical protein BHM03_00026538 [Ensete ventricosum]